jgi:hypothetical protein
MDLLDGAEDHRRGALDGPAHEVVPCQNSRNSSELVFSLLVRPLSDIR